MIVQALEWLKMHSGSEQITVGDFDYVRMGYDRVQKPTVSALRFATLSSFAEFCNQQSEVTLVKVDDTRQVTAYGDLHPSDLTRQAYANCLAAIDIDVDFKYGQRQEKFIENAQAWFVEDDTTDRANLLRIVGTLRSSDIRTMEDDGVSQQVSTAKGVVSKAMEVMPNPVKLRVYETFNEVDQPLRKYVVRISGNAERGDALSIRLLPVPDPMFDYRVMEQIADYLETKLTGATVLK